MQQPQSDPLSLRFGYWVAVHSARLRTWWAISILVIDIAFLGYFVYAFAGYSLSTIKTVRAVEAMARPLVSPTLRQQLAPETVVIGDAKALPRNGGRYDLVAPVTNPNDDWTARAIRYRFVFGTETRIETISLWPGQSGYLMLLNVEAPSGTSSSPAVRAEIVETEWQRPADLTIFREIAFTVTDQKLTPVTTTNDGTATRVTATLNNTSVYSLRRLRFGVVLTNGGSPVAVNEIVVPSIGTLGSVPVEATWLGGLPLASQVTIVPVFDLLDPQTFQAAAGQ